MVNNFNFKELFSMDNPYLEEKQLMSATQLFYLGMKS